MKSKTREGARPHRASLLQTPRQLEMVRMSKILEESQKSLQKLLEKEKGLGEAGRMAHVAQVVHHGKKLTLPEGMDIPDAIALLIRRAEYLEEKTVIKDTFDVFPYDGANAIFEVLAELYGWAQGVPTPGFWGPEPPALINIEVAPGEFKRVPWGSFAVPNVKGRIETRMTWQGNRLQFELVASVLRKDEATVSMIFQKVRAYLKESSIYRGQAIKIRFLDEKGNRLQVPEVQFIDTKRIQDNLLIFSDKLMAAVDTNLFTPITRVKDLITNGIRVKRGVLLGGTFGTGKTLAASVAAKRAVEAGLTHLYVPRADELSIAIEFAKQYQNPAAVVYCEDIDRAVAGERTVKMDDLLNIIDGIDTKTTNIIVILTTNDLDAINPAMLRPGRLDAVLEITPPDAGAIERLIRAYGGDAIKAETSLARAGQMLDGAIPAVITEVLTRAKLAQLRLNQPGEPITHLSEDAIIEAAHTMKGQLDLLASKLAPKPKEVTMDTYMRGLVKAESERAFAEVSQTLSLAGEIKDKLDE